MTNYLQKIQISHSWSIWILVLWIPINLPINLILPIFTKIQIESKVLWIKNQKEEDKAQVLTEISNKEYHQVDKERFQIFVQLLHKIKKLISRNHSMKHQIQINKSIFKISPILNLNSVLNPLRMQISMSPVSQYRKIKAPCSFFHCILLTMLLIILKINFPQVYKI